MPVTDTAASHLQTRGRRRIGEILVAERIITLEQLEDALAAQAAADIRERLGTTVVRLGMAREEDIADALAHQLQIRRVDLNTLTPEQAALLRVPRQLALRHQALPLALDAGALTIATADPTNVFARDDLRVAAGVDTVRMVVATESAIRTALVRAYGSDQTAIESLQQADDSVTPIDDGELEQLDRDVDEQPIVKLANLILADAVRARASDVHVEPGRTSVRVRYRVDGLLREVMRVPRDASAALTSRLKIMARLDIAERRRPQDGRSLVRVEDQEVDLRVSTLPTMFGESTVLRLLRKGAERLELPRVGLAEDHLQLVRGALDRPQGLIILTGPTGSGKTSTLYAALGEIADPVRNIITLEDPIEYQLDGVNQTQINDKVGLTFARGLRSILRQDPDVVLVGEIRDSETAQLAMQASFTGHLVLSTLHTNDAPSTIVRLVDLGVEPFLIASALLMVVGQRLVRLVCEHCKEPAEPDPRSVALLGLSRAELEDARIVRGRGCELCGRTGFLGRIGVFEVLPVTAGLRELIVGGATETAIARLARDEGMRSLRQDGIRKALAGWTTLEEVLRVTPTPTAAAVRCRNCGATLTEDYVVCPACGVDVAENPCAGCGRALDPSWHTCPYCRTVVARTTTSTPTPVPVTTYANVPAGSVGRPAREDGSLPVLLVVDDDPVIRDVLTMMLGTDYRIVEAGDGETALVLAREHQPDAVILDINMPGIDGIEVTRRMREDAATRWIPVLMLTGNEDPEVEVASLLAGADDFLAKPLDEAVLRGRLVAARRRAAAAN